MFKISILDILFRSGTLCGIYEHTFKPPSTSNRGSRKTRLPAAVAANQSLLELEPKYFCNESPWFCYLQKER